MPIAILSNRLYIPREEVRPEDFPPFIHRLEDKYQQTAYTVETFRESPNYWGFSRGDLGKLQQVFGRFHIDDQRVAAPVEYPLKFTGKLGEEQARTLKEWIKVGYGMLQAPARWGKTVWMTALMCKLKQRTLMLAHQEDLCNQLEDTIRRMTNIDELEDQYERKLCGVLQEWDDFFPVVTLSTYQCFGMSSSGRRAIRDKKDFFGLVMVDECSRCATGLYTDVVSVLNAAYRCGVTATPTRKDERHVIINDVLGPVTVVGTKEQLPVEWSWEPTGVKVPEFGNWGTMWKRLVKVKNRNKKIAARVVEDVEAGHFVLVTTDRLAHMKYIKDEIEALDEDITIGILNGQTKDRDSFRHKALRGKYQVVIAMNSIVQLGYNVPRWSSFHNTLPMTNVENWYQRISRIRTPMEPAFEGDDYQKPSPVARVWVDQGHKAIWAYRGVVRRENDRLGFVCLNPEPKRKKGAKRKGMVLFEDPNDET